MENNSYKVPLIGILLAWAASADVIELKNGHTLEGLIAKETTNSVVLNVGLGEVTLQRSRIRKIVRSSAKEDAGVQEAWQEKYFSHRNFVPARFKELAAQLETVVNHRNSALNSSREIEQLKRETETRREQIKRDQADWIRTHESIKLYPERPSFTSRDEVEVYNGLISKGNMLQSSAVLNQQAIATELKQIDGHHANMADYIRKLGEFKELLDAQSSQTTNEAVFLAQAKKKIAAYDRELRRIELPYDENGEQAVLEVRINDAQTGKFLLDTGASLVVISREFSTWLQLDLNTNNTTQVVLANGEEATAHPVMLKSVQSGEARAEDVPAVVMEKPPGPGLDGLLGMTFLRNFVLRFDARTRQVELIQFRPSG